MSARKIKIVGLLFICTVLLLGLAACKVEPAADTEKKWTVTIDPRGLTLGGTLTISVSDGATATLPSDYSIPTDYEIPYYSTVKDDPSVPFEFGTTKVTSDITVYPHFRYQEDKVVKNISGVWLNTSVGTFLVSNEYIYKISADNSRNGYCKAFTIGEGLNLDLSDSNNSAVLADLINLDVPTFESGAPWENIFNKEYSNKNTELVCTYFAPLDLAYSSKISDIIDVKNSKFFTYGAGTYKLEVKDASNITLTAIGTNLTAEISLKKIK